MGPHYVVLSHHGMARAQDADRGDGLQILWIYWVKSCTQLTGVVLQLAVWARD